MAERGREPNIGIAGFLLNAQVSSTDHKRKRAGRRHEYDADCMMHPACLRTHIPDLH